MTPDYLICLECESPTYVFEWADDKIKEATCTTCGNDDPAQFATEDEYEALAMDARFMTPERDHI
jgi:translation initiation factor 2 beta subunit (eIF-2beta)/eIF-5